MFGDFYHNHRLIPSSQISTIKDGTPLVRMSNIFPYYQFGIYYKGRVIQQRFDSRDELTFYEELPMNQFLIGRDLKLFEYTPVKYEYSKLESLELAKSCLNDNPQVGAFSVFGDDFVFYCLVGDRMESFFNGSKMGRHFKHKYKEGFLSVYHHAIALEEDIIVHFTDSEDPSETIIAFSPFNYLHNPVEVEYENDSYEQRMISRNRAIFAWANSLNGKHYNFVTNNCEHFATWCRTGWGYSKQVQSGILDLAIGALCLVAPQAIPLTAKRFKKYL